VSDVCGLACVAHCACDDDICITVPLSPTVRARVRACTVRLCTYVRDMIVMLCAVCCVTSPSQSIRRPDHCPEGTLTIDAVPHDGSLPQPIQARGGGGGHRRVRDCETSLLLVCDRVRA
jgi:hypothetical protein